MKAKQIQLLFFLSIDVKTVYDERLGRLNRLLCWNTFGRGYVKYNDKKNNDEQYDYSVYLNLIVWFEIDGSVSTYLPIVDGKHIHLSFLFPHVMGAYDANRTKKWEEDCKREKRERESKEEKKEEEEERAREAEEKEECAREAEKDEKEEEEKHKRKEEQKDKRMIATNQVTLILTGLGLPERILTEFMFHILANTSWRVPISCLLTSTP